jgi:hypothetical protein
MVVIMIMMNVKKEELVVMNCVFAVWGRAPTRCGFSGRRRRKVSEEAGLLLYSPLPQRSGKESPEAMEEFGKRNEWSENRMMMVTVMIEK